ncbi:DNA-binding protein [Sulfurimonas marina]|uniref:DNA-binding protein n=1 Tax=Sulfurimonas marina TaxID=2590551 RepID=A0A7M3V915_9BACT|nr:DNA-binding protein [Sulfurimonas marina]QOP40248.1 DNA-binding protein [Sulfurimonas marina]
MKKMSVEDAATFFGVSKEAIHNRIRRGSIQSVVENGIKLVVVDEQAKAPQKRATATKSINNDRYYKYLEEQNAKLQQRVDTLEGETRSLRDQKEQMLIEEKEKLERIYKEKDEQLKNILHTLSSKFMLSAAPSEELEAIEQHDAFEAEIEEETPSELISLKKYLKSLKLSEKKMIKTLKKFKELEDDRIVRVGKKIYIDPLKYDYSDLIKK